MKKYSMGIDFGTLSARAVLADVENGALLDFDSVYTYPHAVITSLGDVELPKDYALQHPKDYINALEFLIPDVVAKNGVPPHSVVGIGIDFTSCTVLPIDGERVPLCMRERFAARPHAYAKLWKHHGAQKYVSILSEAVEKYGKNMLESSGNSLSSEFMIPKLYEIYAEDRDIYDTMHTFINGGDYIASLLSGGEEVHSMAYAVIKEHYSAEDGGYPCREFFASLGEDFADAVEKKLVPRLNEVGERVGGLCAEWAKKTGLAEGTAIATPLIDAQSSLAAMGLEEGKVLLVAGTSAVIAVNTDKTKKVAGVLSRGVGSSVPDTVTFESGLAAMGDLFAWFVDNCVPSSYEKKAEKAGMGIHAYLRSLAQKKKIGETGLIALDWWNGNRSVIQNECLSGMIVGLRLSTKPEDIYRALLESAAYGIRRNCENYEAYGVKVGSIAVTGGIAHKDPFLMQILADVLSRPVSVLDVKQSAALGAAIYGAVAAGEYPDVLSASDAMRCECTNVYLPDEKSSAAYNEIYAHYLKLYDGFGRSELMNELFELRKK